MYLFQLSLMFYVCNSKLHINNHTKGILFTNVSNYNYHLSFIMLKICIWNENRFENSSLGMLQQVKCTNHVEINVFM